MCFIAMASCAKRIFFVSKFSWVASAAAHHITFIRWFADRSQCYREMHVSRSISVAVYFMCECECVYALDSQNHQMLLAHLYSYNLPHKMYKGTKMKKN